jgi:hypothetical protein
MQVAACEALDGALAGAVTRAAANLSVAEAKARASRTPAGQDTSAKNAGRAEAEGWPRTGGPTHRPDQ